MTEQTEPAPAVWIDGHPQLEAIAAAVYERCTTGDGGIVHDDPRNIAVAALSAVSRELAAFAEYENAITWMTMCTSCARVLDSCIRETERAERAEQDVRRLGLMVDEYGAGASALTDKLKRVRDLHRETCPVAQGVILPPAAVCGLCEVLDAPAAAVLPASVDRSAVLRDFLWRLEQSAGDAAAEKFLDDNPDLAALLAAAASAVVVRRATDETPGEARCRCPHPDDEHSVYGCADGCACEWMPARAKKPPMDPWHILGIKADDEQLRIVAYSPGGRTLRCLGCRPNPLGSDWRPITANDLDNGGVCTACGVDVLIPQQPKQARP